MHVVSNEHREHVRVGDDHAHAERATRRVIALTLVTMVAEIAAGTVFQSMALLADGWHMASHAAALAITAFAYSYARRNSDNQRYAFGTWKVGALGGFASAIVLGVVALLLAWESIERLGDPRVIAFDEAIVVAIVGLIVNLVSALMLGDGHSHAHDGHADTNHEHSDHNLRAAYAHVVTDALTSVLAIAALLAGRFGGWVWLDPAIGLLGAVIIARWAVGLIRDTSRILLDGDVEPELAAEVKRAIEERDDNEVVDIHLWRTGPRGISAIISLATHEPRPPEHYKAMVAEMFGLTHVTVEVHECSAPDCRAVGGALR